MGRVLDASPAGAIAGKCHRNYTARLNLVRVKRCGKSAPGIR